MPLCFHVVHDFVAKPNLFPMRFPKRFFWGRYALKPDLEEPGEVLIDAVEEVDVFDHGAAPELLLTGTSIEAALSHLLSAWSPAPSLA